MSNELRVDGISLANGKNVGTVIAPIFFSLFQIEKGKSIQFDFDLNFEKGKKIM